MADFYQAIQDAVNGNIPTDIDEQTRQEVTADAQQRALDSNDYSDVVQFMSSHGISPRQTESEETKGNGPVGWFKDAVDSGIAGVLGGQARTTGTFFGVGNDAADYFNDMAKRNSRTKEYTYKDLTPFSSDYWTNPQGALYDIGNMAGSGIALGGEVAAAIGAIHLLGAPTLASVASTLATRAAAHGMTGLASALNSKFAPLIIGKVLTTIPEVISEGGNTIDDIKADGGTLDEQKAGAVKDMVAQAPWLTISNLLEASGLGTLLGSTTKSVGGKIAKGAAGVTGGALQNAWEEGMQQASQNYGEGKRDSALSVVNPFSWGEDEITSAASAIAPGALFGTAGSLGSHFVHRGENTDGNANIHMNTGDDSEQDGMDMPLSDDEMEDNGQAGAESDMQAAYGTDNDTVNTIVDAANQYGIDPKIAIAIAMRESGGDTVDGISMADGGGMFQILPDTDIRDGNGGRVRIEDLYPDYQTDPKQNALAGMAVLKDKIEDAGGDTWDGVTRYNGGGDAEYLSKVRGNYDSLQGEDNSEKKLAAGRPMPIADGIEDAGLAHTNTELRHGVDALNTWVYDTFGKDLTVSGGWRSLENNASVNGAEHSRHLSGMAIDVDASSLTEDELAQVEQKAKEMGFNADGEDMYHDKGSGYHLHLSMADGNHIQGTASSTAAQAQKRKTGKDDMLGVMKQFMTDNQHTYDADTNNAIDDALESNNPDKIAKVFHSLPDSPDSVQKTLTDALDKTNVGKQTDVDSAISGYLSGNKTAAIPEMPLDGSDPVAMNHVPTGGTDKQLPIPVKKMHLVPDLGNSRLVDMTKRAFRGDAKAMETFQKLRPEVQQQLKQAVGADDLTSAGTIQQEKKSDMPAVPDKSVPPSQSNVISKRPSGHTVQVVTDDGTEFHAQYKLVDAGDLVTSHTPNNYFEPNKKYPQQLQPRSRQNTAMRQQVMQMAGALRPADVADSRNLNNGAPLINADGIVENGNGRSMAIIRALKGGHKSGLQYTQYLKDHAAEFGFTPEQVESMRHPVLVRQRMDDVDIQKIINSTAGGATLSASEQAHTDAKAIRPVTLGGFTENESGDLTTKDNRQFIHKALMDVTGNDAGKMNALLTSDGKVSQQGISRIRNALFAKAYKDSDLLSIMSESTDNNIRNITNALTNCAPYIAGIQVRMAEGTLHNIDFVKPIIEACKKMVALRESGKPVQIYLQEQSMFGEDISDTAKDVLDFFDKNKRGMKRIRDMIMDAGNIVEKLGNPLQMSMFDEQYEIPSAGDILETAVSDIMKSQEFTPSKGVSPHEPSAPHDISESGQTGADAGTGTGQSGRVDRHAGSTETPVRGKLQQSESESPQSDQQGNRDKETVVRSTHSQKKNVHNAENKPSDHSDGFSHAGNTSSTMTPKTTKIEDFGEKIGGARKDIYGAYKEKFKDSDKFDVQTEPLSNIFPEPSYSSLLEAGVHPLIVGTIRSLRESIPTKPRQVYKLQKWTEFVKTVKIMAENIFDKNPEYILKMASSDNGLIKDIFGRAKLYEAVGHTYSLRSLRLTPGQYSIFEGKKYDPPKTIWSVEKKAGIRSYSHWPNTLAFGNTEEAAIQSFKENYKKLMSNKDYKRPVSFELYINKKTLSYQIGKKVGRNILILKDGFKTAAEARSYRNDHLDELTEKLSKMKEVPRERRDINQPRIGKDMRNGQNVTPEMFSEAFGFRGVEFGNWVEGKRRQENLNEAYDALMDLAAIVNVTPKALSLNGLLGLAFGARGIGGSHSHAAHYEPNKAVINLTKMSGAGNLGHEWLHALDNFFGNKRRSGKFMSTESDVQLAAVGSKYFSPEGVRPEIVQAFAGIQKAIDSTGMKERSSKLDRVRSKEYWSTHVELYARAFESYLVNKLHDQNAANDYLVNIVPEPAWNMESRSYHDKENSYPYATEKEMPVIREAFDHLFQTIEEKKTDKGVTLYQVSVPTITHVFDKIDSDYISDKKQYDVAHKSEIKRSYDDVLLEVKKAFPKGKFSQDGNAIHVAMQNGARITIDIKDKILKNDKEAGNARKAHGLSEHAPITFEGSWRRTSFHDLTGLIEISKESRDGAAYHEAYHAAWDMALTDKEKSAMLKYYEPAAKEKKQDVQEVMADAYQKWVLGKQRGQGSIFGKLFQRIHDFVTKIRTVLTGIDNVHDVMRRIENGEVWQHDVKNKNGEIEKNHSANGKLLSNSRATAGNGSLTKSSVSRMLKGVKDYDRNPYFPITEKKDRFAHQSTLDNKPNSVGSQNDPLIKSSVREDVKAVKNFGLKNSAEIGDSPNVTSIQYSVRKATENLANNLGKAAAGKSGSIEVQNTKRSVNSKFGGTEYWIRSPSYLAQKFPHVRGFFKLADKAMQRQEELRSQFDRVMNRVYKNIHNSEEQKEWQHLLWLGDTMGKEFTSEELTKDGYAPNVVRAYTQTRNAVKKAYTLLNDARTQTSKHQKNMSGEELRDLHQNIFAEITKIEPVGRNKYMVVWKQQKTWKNQYTVSKQVLDDLQHGTANYLGDTKNKSQILSIVKTGDDEYTIETREGVSELANRKGYIPHFFHDYFVMRKEDSGEMDADDNPIYQYTVVGSGRTVQDAYKKAKQYLKENPDTNLVIQPKQFSFDKDEYVKAAVIGDTEYRTVVDRLAKDMEMTPEQAKELLNGKVTMKSRHRFFGNFMKRKGAEGFEKDIDWALRHYFNATSRYVAMEGFKPNAIGLFERYFGRFDDDYTNKPLAQYTKQYINDMNGNPAALETFINNFLNNRKLWRKYVVSNFGERAALQLASNITGKVSILKLGFLNLSSALLNLTQLMNTIGIIGEFTPVGAGMKHSIHPGFKEQRIFKETGIMNDITLDTASGYNKFTPKSVFGKSMYLFRTMDMYARRATVLAAYNKGRKDGMNHEEAIQYAKEVNRKANFDYSVADAPNVFRRGSILAQIALQFKKYPIKEIELMADILANGSLKQNAKFWGTYFLLCGLFQIPAGDWFDDMFKTIFGFSPKLKAKELIMKAAGDDPLSKEIAKIAIYGITAASPLNMDISARVGVGDVNLDTSNGVAALLGGPAYSTVIQSAKAITAYMRNEGGVLDVAKALSPAVANYMQAWSGATEGYRGRKNRELDTQYDMLLKASGFRSVDDSIGSDIKQIIADDNTHKTAERKNVVDRVLNYQQMGVPLSQGDIEDMRRLNITGKILQNERMRKRSSAEERITSGMSQKERADNRPLLDFMKSK